MTYPPPHFAAEKVLRTPFLNNGTIQAITHFITLCSVLDPCLLFSVFLSHNTLFCERSAPQKQLQNSPSKEYQLCTKVLSKVILFTLDFMSQKQINLFCWKHVSIVDQVFSTNFSSDKSHQGLKRRSMKLKWYCYSTNNKQTRYI